MNRFILSLTLLTSLLFPSAEGDAAKVFGPMVKPAVVAPSYVAVGGWQDNNTTTTSYSAALGTSSKCFVVAGIAMSYNGNTITGVTIGGVSAGSQISGVAGGTGNVAFYGKYYATCPGTQTITVTTTDTGGSHTDLYIWVASNLTSTTPVHTQAYQRNGGTDTPTDPVTISVTAGDLMFGLANSYTSFSFSGYTQTPTDSVLYAPQNAYAQDWLIAATNSAFQLNGVSVGDGSFAYMTLH